MEHDNLAENSDGASGASGAGNTKRPLRDNGTLNWCFTWNNYSEDDVSELREWLGAIGARQWVVGREVGESGTPHLQGCVKLLKKKRLSSLHKKWPRVHWEKTRNWSKSVAYCQKEGAAECHGLTSPSAVAPIPCRDPLLGRTPLEWQREVLEIVRSEPDDRTVYWYWEPLGRSGKTTLAKSILLTNRDSLLLGGKAADCKYAIAQMVEKKRIPKVILFDIVRSCEQYVSYQALEEVKNGMFFSGKYEAGMVLIECPHVICFANFPPEIGKLSSDRWVIREISESCPSAPSESLRGPVERSAPSPTVMSTHDIPPPTSSGV